MRSIIRLGRIIPLLALLFIASGVFAETLTRQVLPNGLTVLIKEVHAAPVVVVDVWYKVGSRNEGPGLTGASHLLEHMTYKGTKEFAKDDMRSLTKRNGAIDNGATFYDYTHYYTTIASDRLDLVLRMEASRMSTALIQQKDLDSERTVVRSELEGNENNPGRLLFQEIMASAFRAHPYHWPVIGWRADIEHVTADQLRKYYRTYYIPNNATLVIVGDVDTAKALDLVKKRFGALKRGPQPPQWVTPEPPQYGERRVTVRRQGQLPIEMIAWHIPAITHVDTPALALLEQILGAGRLSRMYQQIVEKQIGVGAWASALVRRDSGLFTVGGYVRPGQPIQPLEDALLAEVERVKTTPPTAEEMQRALRQYEAGLVYGRDSVTSQASQLGEAETVTEDYEFNEKLLVKMREVKPEEVSRVAKQYLTEDNRTVGVFQPAAKVGSGTPAPAPTASNFRAEAPVGIERPKTTPAVGNTRAEPAKRERFVLPNGIVLIVQENHANATVAVSANLKAGRAYDAAGKTGTADMVAYLLDRGTTTRTSNQIAAELEGAAASIDSGTGWETTGIHGKALSSDTELLLRNMADLMRNATFPADEIEKMREQMLAGLAMNRDEPAENARRAFYRAVLPAGHPYRLASFDEEEAGTKAITRDDLLAFYRARYVPQTVILAVVGDVDIAAVRKLVDRYFGDWNGETPSALTFPNTNTEKTQRIVTPIPDKAEVAIYVGHADTLKRTDPEYYASQIMNLILGGGGALNSRLGDVIRDQHGLAYTVSSGFHASTGAGPWSAELGVNPKNVDQAVTLLQAEIARMREKGATQQEVSDAVAYLTGAYAITLETNTALANTLMDAEYFSLGLNYPERLQDLYNAVTLAQVNAAAKKYLHPDQLTISIAGSYEEGK